ncbi:hypothetical protein [Leptospira sarikeiensis]|uniref:Lipoprotein n=1 Tax=Leptospira sarikeiensis TaxID=2484943 RepID=A0A4R9K0I2_9LEPT|nr:hypothetical protein [Leptospira sarikeiensis]TGL58516.1 hypothetical protein EHQ64_18580 [Leptospira sarikeiensis]
MLLPSNYKTILTRFILRSLAIIALTSGCFVSCLGYHFTIPKETLQTEVKTVSVLPLYIPSELFPQNENIPVNIQPNVKESEIYSSAIQKENEFFTKLAVKVLKDGKYKFETLSIKEEIQDTQIQKTEVNTRNGLEIALTAQLHQLSKETAVDLCKKYKVDAIFFHAIFIHYKSNQYSYIRRLGVQYPTYKLSYLPLIYNREGEIIFNSNYFMQDLGTVNTLHENPVDPSQFLNVKMSKQEFENQFDKKFYRVIDLEKRLFQGVRTGTVDIYASLCGNLVSCQLIYEETVEELEGK